MACGFEAVMLYLADIPTIWCFDLMEMMLSSSVAKQLAGSHPFYIPLNILGSLIWGFLFMLAFLTFSLIKRRGKLSLKSRNDSGLRSVVFSRRIQ